ncbi:hypothetical protein GWO43_06070, partial [candidate division KSB1 bacterium]|nr:hypothetical protein [candidate division KSB1 bacterium]NIS23518.1 hypothetical protein [candidate division KSB1 bacterium]NIT70454.1 hypothetical protein [candidate division KSB1 bacterium]NIU24142.1 hypothetical protein [candidate division KSB1 bacterium]NIU93297.1 hypothetical protein [candidate division KSB1 bacterium]
EQSPIALTGHARQRSWQRTTPKERGETKAGGNSIAGHDETSENLRQSFVEQAPTPNRSFAENDIPALRFVGSILNEAQANAKSNGVINPDEDISVRIQLENEGFDATGELFGVLRITDLATDAVVTLVDSTANFPNISPGDSAFSETPFRFETTPDSLPDSLRFTLAVIQKSSGFNAKSFPNQQLLA